MDEAEAGGGRKAETVARAARRVLRGLVDWGALEETGARGVYRAAAARAVDNPPLALWAARAVLPADFGGSRSASVLLRGPRCSRSRTPAAAC